MTENRPKGEKTVLSDAHKVSLLVREIALSAKDEADYVALLTGAFPDVRFFGAPNYAQRHAADPPTLTWGRDLAPFAERRQVVYIILDPDWTPTWRQHTGTWVIRLPSLYGHWERSGDTRPEKETRPGRARAYMTGGRLWFTVSRERPTTANDFKRARKALRLFGRVASKRDIALFGYPEMEFYRVDKEAPWAGHDARAWCLADPQRVLAVDQPGIAYRPWPEGSTPPPPPAYVTALREREPVAGSWAGTPVAVRTAERKGVGVYYISDRVAVPGIQFIERRVALMGADEDALIERLKESFPKLGVYDNRARAYGAEGRPPSMGRGRIATYGPVMELCLKATSWHPRFRLDEQSLEWVLVNRIYPWALWRRSRCTYTGSYLELGLLSFRLLRGVKAQRDVVNEAFACLEAVASTKGMVRSVGKDTYEPVAECGFWVGQHARQWCLDDPRRFIATAYRPAPPASAEPP